MTEANPWKTLDSRLIYENEWIRLREDRVIRPDGNPGIYGVVETRIATGTVAITEDNQVYLVGQYRYPTNHYSWEIVEGGTDGDESALEAAQRELHEEAGLVAKEWRQLGAEIHLSNCFSSEVCYLYIARGLTQVESRPDGTEKLQVRRLPFKEAVSLVHSGEIKDAVSIMGLMRAERILL